MSTLSLFMGASVRRVETPDDAQSPSSLDVVLVLKRVGPINRPVDLARTLKRFGLGLSEAHRALDRIVGDEAVQLRLGRADRETIIADLADLGVAAD